MARSLASVPNQPTNARDRLTAARERFTRAVTEVQTAATELHAAELELVKDVAADGPARRWAEGENGHRLAYRITEVAKLLGVSVEHVNRRIEKRELRTVHMGDAVLILAGDLEAYLATLE